MAKHEVEAQWVELDPATLPEQAKKLYQAYKDAYKVVTQNREAFETVMQAGVPEGSRIVFGYRFGKLSAAIVPDDRKPAKAKATTQSLAEFLAAQAGAGHRS